MLLGRQPHVQDRPGAQPLDRARSAGGSSSGSAALVAAGHADLALGGDQGGSVRIPSAFCGMVGHKPTHGLVPYTGAFPIENTIDHLGPITRTVADAAVLLSVLAGPDGLDSRGAAGLEHRSLGLPRRAGRRRGRAPGRRAQRGIRHPRPVAARRRRGGARGDRGAGGGGSRGAAGSASPGTATGCAVWTVIGTDGVVTQLIDGNAYGMNTPGRYDPELIAHYARGRRSRRLTCRSPSRSRRSPGGT